VEWFDWNGELLVSFYAEHFEAHAERLRCASRDAAANGDVAEAARLADRAEEISTATTSDDKTALKQAVIDNGITGSVPLGKVIVRPEDEFDWLEDRYERSRWTYRPRPARHLTRCLGRPRTRRSARRTVRRSKRAGPVRLDDEPHEHVVERRRR
jgi:hypothetical protein